MTGDIVDAIDALIDEQMAGGEPRTGYNFGDPTFPRCPHCNRHFHGLPVTERIDAMYRAGRYDDTYVAADDTTRILCQGSAFIGPMPHELTLAVHSARPRRWWRHTTTYLPLQVTHHDGMTDVRFPNGDELTTLQLSGVGLRFDDTPAPYTMDILSHTAPRVGGPWAPLTALGVETHPSQGLTRVGPNRWDFDYTPEVGQRVSAVTVNGHTITGTIQSVSPPDGDTTEFTVRPDVPPGSWRALSGWTSLIEALTQDDQ